MSRDPGTGDERKSCSWIASEMSIHHSRKGTLIPVFLPKPEQFQAQGKPNDATVPAETFPGSRGVVQKPWMTARSIFKVI